MKLRKSFHLYGPFQTFMRSRGLWVLAFMGMTRVVLAQTNASPDYFRSIGKIYVVAGVCLIILVTLLVYLINLDRKIAKLEKRHKNE